MTRQELRTAETAWRSGCAVRALPGHRPVAGNRRIEKRQVIRPTAFTLVSVVVALVAIAVRFVY